VSLHHLLYQIIADNCGNNTIKAAMMGFLSSPRRQNDNLIESLKFSYSSMSYFTAL
jgi:hypothetical protein